MERSVDVVIRIGPVDGLWSGSTIVVFVLVKCTTNALFCNG